MKDWSITVAFELANLINKRWILHYRNLVSFGFSLTMVKVMKRLTGIIVFDKFNEENTCLHM